MATAVLFQNYQITASIADTGRLISFTQDWIGVGIRVDAITGSCTFKLQWSNDNVTWADDPVPFAAVTVPGTYVSGKRQVLGLYWRLAAVTAASATCSAGAVY